MSYYIQEKFVIKTMKNTSISEQIHFTSKVFGWATVGFFISGIIAYKLLQNFYLVQSILENYFILGALVLGFIGFVIWISLNMDKWDFNRIRLFFFGFAILNGIILPLIFHFFTQNFIISTFFILAGMFGAMGVLGYLTKQDLTSWTSLVIMAIVGIVLNVLLHFVWINDKFQLITSSIAILIFVGITAYSSKTIQEMNEIHEPQKTEIMGAFALSLNLYYLFIALVLEANKGNRRGDGGIE
jgi:uncharacterized protein